MEDERLIDSSTVLLGGSLEIREHSSLIFTEVQRDSGPDPRSHSWFWNWTPGLSIPSHAVSDTGVPKSQGPVPFDSPSPSRVPPAPGAS